MNTHLSDICRENADKHIAKISCRCAKIDKNNNILEKYSSYHEAARKNGLDGDMNASKIRAVCKGERSSIYGTLFFRDLDENDKIIERSFKSYKNRKTLIGIDVNNPEDIRYFSSISEAAKELNTDRQSIGQCIQGKDRYSIIKGYILREIDSNGDIIETQKTIEERLKEYNETNPVINGERHSITEWCAILGISRYTYYYRKKQGKSTLEALLLPKKR